MTIHDVAKKAGVSIATVSRAITGNASVREETRKHIMQVAQQMGYMPSRAAQSLADRGKTSGTRTKLQIRIVYEPSIGLKDQYFSTVIHTIVDEASRDGIVTTIASLVEDYDALLKLSAHMGDHENAGTILVGNIADRTLDILAEHCANCVIVDKPSTRIPSVYNDNEGGAFAVVGALAAAGCRRIGLIHGPRGHYFTESILQGYRRGLEACELPFVAALCASGDFHVEGGYEAMRALLARAADIDGVFTNDEMGMGALRALREAGQEVPRDVCVHGFDDLKASREGDQALSTVAVNYDYMARTAVRKLIENSREKEIVPVRIILPVSVVQRRTTRPAAKPPAG